MRIEKIGSISKPYFFSILTVCISTIICFFSLSLFGDALSFAFFLPAVMVSAWYGGQRAGIAATMLSLISMYYFFSSPHFSLFMKSFSSIIQLLLFLGEACAISCFIDGGHALTLVSAFRKRQEENKKNIEMLQKKLHDAKQETALRDEFLAIASHELKTPLTTVVLQIQTSLHNIRNVSLSEFSVERLLKMLENMQNQTKRLSQMINDLLNISLITTHKMTLEMEDVDLATLIKDTVDNFKERLEKDNVEFSVAIHDSVVGKWDKLRLEQVLDNLISNAIKYGNKKPIRIALEKQNNNAVIHVADEGIGIKDSEKTKIFSLFKRGTMEKDYKGLGIGLYIAQQIVLLHKGKIELKSRHGQGSTFTITLPIL